MISALVDIEAELKKRTRYKQIWNRKQTNAYDHLTKFIYATKSFDDVLAEVKTRFANHPDIKDIGNYAVNRWFNFWSAQALETMFAEHPRVKAHTAKDRLCDFFIDGVPFDLKTTVFPQRATFDVKYAKQHPEKLALWFYEHQSAEQRQHYANRLFLVLHKESNPAISWTLKAELTWLQSLIKNYLDNFDAAKLMELQYKDHRFKTDIIRGIQP
jgi:hypothetical protein